MVNDHIIWHDQYVKRQERNQQNGHKSGLVWFTGLSASGKSTIAHNVERRLFEKGFHVYAFDGDNIRHGINSNLGFSREDRKENLRRIAELSKLFIDAGFIVLAAFISPYKDDREYIRKRFEGDNFLEIYVKCPVEMCEERDPKGQYKKAREGIIKNYTGISAPYEEPESPELVLDTDKLDIVTSTHKVLELLERNKFIEFNK
jgi:adenylylsulfate kinase